MNIDLRPFVGIPYVDKGTDPAVGLDCWQLAKYFYKKVLGLDIPDYMAFYETGRGYEGVSAAIQQNLKDWQVVAAPDFGDVVVFRIWESPWHVGINLGGSKMLHTDVDHMSVIESYDTLRWRNRIYGYYKWNL